MENEENDSVNLKRIIGTMTHEELDVKNCNNVVKSLHKLISNSEYFSLKNFVSDQGLWGATLEEVKKELINSIEND